MKKLINHKIQRLKLTRKSYKFLSSQKKDIGTNLETQILLLAHSLEKGMSIPSPRKGFGKAKALQLCNSLNKYKILNKDTAMYSFAEGVEVLKTYIDYSEKNDIEVNEIKKQLDNLNYKSKNIFQTGNIETTREELTSKLTYEEVYEFLNSRHSVRSYENVKVDKQVLEKVIEMASLAPSACNRQPNKVYFTSDNAKVAKINEYVPGNQGFQDEVPNWAFITTDKEMFGKGEILQWFVNGGIYLAYFVNALHANKLESCIFQMTGSHEGTDSLRNLLNLPDNEVLIAGVGFGVPKKSLNRAGAQRKAVSEVLFEI